MRKLSIKCFKEGKMEINNWLKNEWALILGSSSGFGGEVSKKLSEWSELGVLKANGDKLPNRNLDAYLVFPEGEDGKKFLVYENFKVIMKWNRSLFFGISVGTLSDMIEYH